MTPQRSLHQLVALNPSVIASVRRRIFVPNRMPAFYGTLGSEFTPMVRLARVV